VQVFNALCGGLHRGKDNYFDGAGELARAFFIDLPPNDAGTKI